MDAFTEIRKLDTKILHLVNQLKIIKSSMKNPCRQKIQSPKVCLFTLNYNLFGFF